MTAPTREFLGEETITVDSNGRFKLPADFLRDFQAHTDGSVYLFCLPEGGLGIYPPAAWEAIRSRELESLKQYASSLAVRRMKRYFGARSALAQITGQGRVSLPSNCRKHTGLEAPCTAILSGCEDGVELWHPDRFEAEFEAIREHQVTKGELSMYADLGPEPGTTMTFKAPHTT